MINILLLIVRSTVICVGLLLLYIALFLHEDEEQQLQNSLEELWVRIDDAESRALSKRALFLKENIALINGVLARILGERLFSVQSVSVTFIFSMSSILFFLWVQTDSKAVDYLVIPIGLVCVGSLPMVFAGRRAIRMVVAAVAAGIGAIAFGIAMLAGGLSIGYAFLTVLAAVGVACDVVFVAINRFILRVGARMNYTLEIVLMLVLNIALGGAYISPLMFVRSLERSEWGSVAVLVAETNLFTTLLASLIVLMMSVALLHRVVWPFLSRPIYAIARHGVVRNQSYYFRWHLCF